LRPNPGFSYAAENAGRISRSSSAQVELPIERGDKRAARVDAAQRGRDVAVSDLSGRQLKVRAAVMAAFFDVLAAQELTALAQDSVSLARRATDIAAKRVIAGKVSPVEETKARVAEAGTRVALTQAQSELRNARRRLSSLWGNASPRFSEAQGNVDLLPAVPARESIELRLGTSPSVQRAQLELERRKSLVNVEQSKTVQDVTVSVGIQRREEAQHEQMRFGISIPIPLFNRNQGNLLEALRREDKARDELVATRIALASDVYQVIERLGARRQEVDLLRTEVVPGAKSAYEAATIGFENGKFSFLEVLDAQRTFFSAKSQYLNALAAVHRAVTDLEGILGQPDAAAAPKYPDGR
ncbi:MAG: TolC family protein, partial [Oxalobacteraceae bacterium]|nr:TolC family protein [Oxalobacteraceae bacterium]